MGFKVVLCKAVTATIFIVTNPRLRCYLWPLIMFAHTTNVWSLLMAHIVATLQWETEWIPMFVISFLLGWCKVCCCLNYTRFQRKWCTASLASSVHPWPIGIVYQLFSKILKESSWSFVINTAPFGHVVGVHYAHSENRQIYPARPIFRPHFSLQH